MPTKKVGGGGGGGLNFYHEGPMSLFGGWALLVGPWDCGPGWWLPIHRSHPSHLEVLMGRRPISRGMGRRRWTRLSSLTSPNAPKA